MRNTLYMKAIGLTILVLVIAAIALALLNMGKKIVTKATSDNTVWQQEFKN